MRYALAMASALVTVSVFGCSTLLGINDPKDRSDAVGSDADGGGGGGGGGREGGPAPTGSSDEGGPPPPPAEGGVCKFGQSKFGDGCVFGQ
jgi:hypothetical protein